MKKWWSILVAAAMGVTVLAGCSAGGESAEGNKKESANSPDKTVVVGISTDLKTLDPGVIYEVFGNMITYATYDMPFRITGEDLTPQPSVVKDDWTLDDTKTVYTFHIRDGIQFESGNPMTSADMAWSINRVKNLKSNTVAHVEGIKDIQTPDDKTVIITLKEPDASFLTKLATNAFCILDSKKLEENGGTDGPDAATADTAKAYLDQHSAGSGPYRLVSWTPNVELVLEKNDNYWGESGNVETFIIKEIPDSNTQIQMLDKGEIDIAYTLNSDNIGQLEGKDNVQILRGQSAVTTFLLMNQDEAVGGPLSNPDVQQAVRYAIDYKGLLDLCGEGSLLPKSIVPEGFIGAESKSPDYQDLAKAKELLAKAGYADGFSTTLTAANFDTEGMPWPTIAQKIQSDLKQIGIDIKVETSEIGVVIDQYRQGQSPFLVMHWNPDYYDINNQLAFLPGETVGERANWKTTPENQNLLDLSKKIKEEGDVALRTQYSKELQEAIAENCPYAFLVQHPKVFAVSSRLSDVQYNDLCKIQLTTLNVK